MRPRSVVPDNGARFVYPFAVGGVVSHQYVSRVLRCEVETMEGGNVLFRVVGCRARSRSSRPRVPVVLLVSATSETNETVLARDLREVVVGPRLVYVCDAGASSRRARPRRPIFATRREIRLVGEWVSLGITQGGVNGVPISQFVFRGASPAT